MKTVLILMAVYGVAVAAKRVWGRKLRRIRALRDLDLSFRGFISALGVAVLISAVVAGGALGKDLVAGASGLEESTVVLEERQTSVTETDAVEAAAEPTAAENAAAMAPETEGALPEEPAGREPVTAVKQQAAAAAPLQTEEAPVTAPVPASPYADGTFTGTGTGFKSTIAVAVEIASGVITEVTVTEQRDDRKWFERAYAGVVRQILATQSAAVDTVSGATYSSQGIIDGAAEALDAARAAARQVAP